MPIKESDTRSSIECVLQGILQQQHASEDAIFQQVLVKSEPESDSVSRAVKFAQQGRGDEFYFSLLYPINEFLNGLLASALPGKDRAHFILKHHNFVESHFLKVIVDNESRVCSVDKSRTIMRELLNFYITDKLIKFNYEAEYTYHLPNKVFIEHEAIIDFFEGIYSLYYGNPEKYLKQLALLYINTKAVNE